MLQVRPDKQNQHDNVLCRWCEAKEWVVLNTHQVEFSGFNELLAINGILLDVNRDAEDGVRTAEQNGNEMDTCQYLSALSVLSAKTQTRNACTIDTIH